MAERTHRWRRGRLVEIPEEWRGLIVHDQTRGKRPSKHLHKMRKMIKHRNWGRVPRPAERAALNEQLRDER